MTDQPIAHTIDGRPLFDNTPTVVSVLVKSRGSLLVVRRANNPGRGKLGLPGGYHMRGESWQAAGAREVAEETGRVIKPELLRQVGETVTDEYGNNLMIAIYEGSFHYDEKVQLEGETMECLWLPWAGNPMEWAFPRHYAAAVAEFAKSL